MIINPGTGLAGGGTFDNASRLIAPFAAMLDVFPLHIERCWDIAPPDRGKFMDGYYDYRLSRTKDDLDDCVIVKMPGVEFERVICGHDFDPFSICRVYVNGESFPWPGAIHVARRKLLKIEEEDPG